MRSQSVNGYRLAPSHRRVASRRGVILILGAFMIFGLCGFAAFAIDLGYISLTQAQLQNACDAAALAAVLELKTGQADAGAGQSLEDVARTTALYAASLNFAAGRSVVLLPEEVVFGNRTYTGGAGSGFTNTFPAQDGVALNAVQVSCIYNESSGPRRELDLWFARLINHNTAIVAGASSAFMSPRDLVFCIDISNSMNDDSTNNLTGRANVVRAMVPAISGLADNQIDNGSNSSFVRFRPHQPTNSSGNNTSLNLSFGTTNLGSGSIVGVNVSGFNRIRVAATGHSLIEDDVITIDKSSGSAAQIPSALGTWRVSVIDANSFYLKQMNGAYAPYAGGTYTSSPTVRWRPHAVFANTSGGVRVRIPDPAFATAGHGLPTGSLLRLNGVTGPNINNVYEVTRVGGPSNAEVRYDLNGETFGGTAWTINSGQIRVPNYGTELSTNAERTKMLRQIWLMCLDTNGSYPNAGNSGINVFGGVAAAEDFARYELASGQTDTDYETNKPFGYYTSYDSAGPDPLQPNGAAYSYPNGHPWLHWKWQAYVDAIYGRGYTINLNVLSATGGSYICWDRYARFCLDNGYVPALRGQPVWGRDVNMNGQLDTEENGDSPPPNTMIPLPVRSTAAYATYADYPYYSGFYSKPAYLKDYNPGDIDFTEGSATAGLHPLNIPDLPFSFVRQSTLNGVNAMISDENAGNAAFDQVSVVTFGTRAYCESDLTNDVDQAVIDCNNRLTVTGSNLSIAPYGNGNTNIGGALRMGYNILLNKYDFTMGRDFDKGRTFANKVIALLTDGNPNISPQGGAESPEFTGGSDTVNTNASSGDPYARYWANKCAEEKIVVHTICVGDNSNESLLTDIAVTTGGQPFVVNDPAADVDRLNDIFIAIGKDKIGKLYGN